MANLTSILGTDIISDSRSTINTNFQNLNAQVYRAYKSTPQSVISSVLVTDDQLSFPIGANETWNIVMRVMVDTAPVPDFKYTFTVPAGCAGWFADDDAFQAATVPTSVQTVNVNAIGIFIGDVTGVFMSSVAGSVQLSWAQNNNAVTSVTTVLPGSNIIATKVN